MTGGKQHRDQKKAAQLFCGSLTKIGVDTAENDPRTNPEK